MKKPILIAFATILLLGAGVLVLQNLPEEEQTVSKAPLPVSLTYLIDREDNAVKTVTLVQDGQSTTYTRFDSGLYGVEGYDQRLPFDQAALERLFSSCARLASKKTVEETDDNLSQYGLSAPTLAVEVAFRDGSAATIHVGERSPLEDGYYGRLAEDKGVYLLTTYDVEAFQMGLYDYREKKLFHNISAADFEEYAPDILYLRFERQEGGVLELERPESSIDVAAIQIISPVLADGDEYAFTNTLSRGLFSLKNARLQIAEDNPEDLSVYGLDKPEFLTLTDETATLELLIGSDGGDMAYLMTEGVPCVYQVHKSALSFFYTDYTQLMSKILWIHNIEYVSNLQIHRDGKTSSMEIDNSIPSFVLDGKAVTEDGARSLYLACISPMVAGQVPEDAALEEEILSLAITYRDGQRFTTQFYPINERHIAVYRDGTPTGFYCNKKDVQAVLSALEALEG